MRKILALIAVITAGVLILTACSKNKNTALSLTVEPPVTIEQVNSDSNSVARAYLESLLFGNKEMFSKCYPEGFLEALSSSSGTDVYDAYREAMKINASLVGTADAGYRDYTIENGFDPALIKSRISHVTGLEYSDIGQIRSQKITACFTNGTDTVNSDFQFIVYEVGGAWYMLEMDISE